MNSFQTTDIIVALWPTRIGDAKQFITISQGGAQGSLEAYKKVGARFRFALFEDDGGGGQFYDVGNVTSVQFLISDATSNYVLDVQSGPFANLTAEQWSNGLRPTSQHFLFQFSSTVMNLAAGTYTLSITGNTDDPLAPVDFYCEATLTILARADATGQASALGDSDILNALNAQVSAAIAAKANTIGLPGQRLALTTKDLNSAGKYGRVWLEAVLVDDTTVVIDQQKEFV
jgi:hypothetical protein